MKNSTSAPGDFTTVPIIPARPGDRRRRRPFQKFFQCAGLAAMLATSAAHAQPKLLDCSCLATQAVLFNSACCGFIPDLCTVVSNCYTPSISPAPGYVCTQTPLPGTFVCSNTPITFTLTETNSAAFSDTCSNLVFYVGVSASPFMLLCGPTQVVPCNSTTWSFPPPGWTNTCCTNPITLIGPTLVTNWPVITATWVGIDCNSNVDSCNDTILFSSSNGVCNCLDIFCPSNIVVQTCFSGLAGSTNFGFTNISYPFPVASNYCIGVITNITCTPISGSPFPVGTNTVTCTVYDNLGNSASCTFDIIVLGNTTPPTVICGPNQTVQCGSVWAPIPPTAFSACCTNFTIMLVSAVTNTSSTCLETIDFWWHVTDCNNNFADCTNTVTVVDTTPPVINCRSNYTIQCANTAGTTNGWQAFPPSAFDACCGTVLVTLINVVTNSGVVPCNGTVTLTWQATDCCSNTAICTEVATIVDTNPPTINCAGPKSVECGTGWTFDPPTAFDSCCGSNVTITVVSNITVFSSPCMSIYTRVWRATDCCTNAAFCSQTVTEIDTQPPVMTCGSNFTVNCGTVWNFTPPTAIDACCGTNVTISVVSTFTNTLSTCPVVITRTWRATDCCSNSTTCTQTVTVVDTVPPVITCGSNKVVQCGTAWAYNPPTAFDVCCGTNVTISLVSTVTNTSGPCLDIITAIWKATDCCGNSSFCTNFVSVVDTIPPVINCRSNYVVQCGSPILPPSATDNCCLSVTVSLLTSATNFINTCNYFVTNTWQATDCCTNTSTCTEVVQVIDTTPPVITCASNKTVQCDAIWTFDPPTAFDLCCGTNVTITVLTTITNVLPPCTTIITRTWRATDCCTNAATCSQIVTVVDTTPPVITCGPNQTVQCGTAWSFAPPTATDNCCPAASISIALINITTNNAIPCQSVLKATWQATDCCGNSSFCTNSVTVIDTIPPVITCRSNYVVQCGSPILPPPVTDNCCSNPTVIILNAVTNGAGPCNKTITITWKATDCCTNFSTCVETVTVTDTTPPVITCASNKIVQCGTNWSFDPPTAFDACCGTNVTITMIGNINFGPFCSRTHIATWQAMDCCSNTATCSQQVTVVDTIPPVITCAPSFSVPAGAPIIFTPPTAVDACCGTNNTIVVMATTTNVTGPCLTTYTRFWKAVDCCGNSSTVCSQSITTSIAPPPNDLCPNAIAITVNAPYICGYTICATPSPVPPLTCLNPPFSTSPDVWYVVTAICTAPMTIDTCQPCAPNPTFDTVLSAYNNNCNALVQVPAAWPYYSCNDDTGLACGLRSTIYFQAVAGQSYRIRVGGFFGATGWFSIRATQSTAPPTNDLCSGAIAVSTGTNPICGSTLCGATPTPAGNLFPAPCGSSASTADVWYRFTPRCSGVVTINTCGNCPPAGNFDTVLSVYTGICPGPLNQVAGGCNDDATFGPCAWTVQSIVQFNATAGVTYYIRVSGWTPSSVGDFALNINQTSPPPPNDLCAAATVVTAGSYAWNNCGANNVGPGSPCGMNNDVWFSYTPACSGLVMVNTCLSSLNTVLAVYSGSCNALNFIGCNDNAGAGSCNGSLQSYLTFNATAGVTYRIRVGSIGATGGGVLNIVGPNPNPTACGGVGGPITNWRLFIITGAGNGIPWAWSVSSPCCASLQNLNTVGVVGTSLAVATAFANSINAQCPGTAFAGSFFGLTYLVIGTHCGSAPVILGVGPAGTAPNNLCIVGGFSLPISAPCGFNPDIYAMDLSGHDYNGNGRDDLIDIFIGDSADVNGNLIPDEVESCFGPQITAKPQSQLVVLGTNVTLSVAVSGTPPFSYQWLLNGTPLPGATGSTLTINPVTATNLGAYSVTVSNACGVAEGASAAVLVQPEYLPVITDASLADGWFRFMVETKLGFNYVVEYKNNLNDPAWTTLTNTPGIGAPSFIYDSAPPPDHRFYHVIQYPAGP